MSESEAVKGSSFFKIFIDNDFVAKTMRIPPAFLKNNMKGKKSGDIVFLTVRADQDHTTWIVNLVKHESSSGRRGLCLSGCGWSKFVNDNSICSGDFAIFRFDGDETFKVTLFEPSGCEKQQ